MARSALTGDHDADKRAAADAAAAEVQDGMVVGLGTGSTVAHVIAALGDRVERGLRFDAVPTSRATADSAVSAGLRVVDFAALDQVELAIDGADEVDPCFRAIKGAGGALLREKIVAAAALRMVAVVDSSKLVDHLGRGPVPIEVLPFALTAVTRAVERLVATVTERSFPAGPFRTDQGNAIIDCWFASVEPAEDLAGTLSSIPGIIGHGLFLHEIDAVYVGSAGRSTCLERNRDDLSGLSQAARS